MHADHIMSVLLCDFAASVAGSGAEWAELLGVEPDPFARTSTPQDVQRHQWEVPDRLPETVVVERWLVLSSGLLGGLGEEIKTAPEQSSICDSSFVAAQSRASLGIKRQKTNTWHPEWRHACGSSASCAFVPGVAAKFRGVETEEMTAIILPQQYLPPPPNPPEEAITPSRTLLTRSVTQHRHGTRNQYITGLVDVSIHDALRPDAGS